MQFFKDLIYYGFEFFGKYYSSYRGFVVNREDPEDYNRLMLVIPTITGVNSYPYWAWPKHNYAGKGYGTQIIPQKGEMVWVEFEMGDPTKPIWCFGHFGTKEKPEKLKGNLDNYWFHTPGGSIVELDDRNKLIRVTDSTGNIYESNSKGISLIRGNRKISLGKLNKASEPAVLGDKNVDVLKDIVKQLNAITTALSIYSKAQAGVTASAPFTPLTAALTTLTGSIDKIKIDIVKLNLPIQKTKSLHVTLD